MSLSKERIPGLCAGFLLASGLWVGLGVVLAETWLKAVMALLGLAATVALLVSSPMRPKT